MPFQVLLLTIIEPQAGRAWKKAGQLGVSRCSEVVDSIEPTAQNPGLRRGDGVFIDTMLNLPLIVACTELLFGNGLQAGQTFLVFLPDHLLHAEEQPHQLGDEWTRAVHGLCNQSGIALRHQREFH